MSQRHYLLNSEVPFSDTLKLKFAVCEGGKKVIEIAECVSNIPFPWIACFKLSDLQACRIPMEDDEILTVNIPCASIEQAIQNLREALPLFEHLTGEKVLAREYWQAALSDLKNLKLPYLTMDLAEMLYIFEADELDEAIIKSLGRNNDAVDYFKENFVAFYTGVMPYPLSDFYASNDINDGMRIKNSIALDAAIQKNCQVRDASYYGIDD